MHTLLSYYFFARQQSVYLLGHMGFLINFWELCIIVHREDQWSIAFSVYKPSYFLEPRLWRNGKKIQEYRERRKMYNGSGKVKSICGAKVSQGSYRQKILLHIHKEIHVCIVYNQIFQSQIQTFFLIFPYQMSLSNSTACRTFAFYVAYLGCILSNPMVPWACHK